MNLALQILIVVSIALPSGWALGCLVGIARCRHRTRRDRSPYWGPPEPWNWRLFLGPKRYLDWYEEKFL